MAGRITPATASSARSISPTTSYPLTGSPYIIDEPDSFLNPIDVKANNTYVGAYALDTFNATDRLTLTGGGAFQFRRDQPRGHERRSPQRLLGLLPPQSDAGFTYKITPDINFYGGYAMTNRTPTPLELGCAEPDRPLHHRQLPVSDPPLKQVVGQTFELGFRGHERA